LDFAKAHLELDPLQDIGKLSGEDRHPPWIEGNLEDGIVARCQIPKVEAQGSVDGLILLCA
jgi:hypothetical protein